MKIFLTGGTGFVGCHFLNLLSQESPDIQIRALRRPGSQPRIALCKEPEWVGGDLGQAESSWFSGCYALVHLAAAGVLPQNANWDDCFRVNLFESLALWRKAQSAGVRRFLICGSCFEYGRTAEKVDFVAPTDFLDPTGSYHSSKAAATMAALGFAAEYHLELAVFRPFHIFGEGEAPGRFWPALRDAAKGGRDFPMTSGEQIRDFTPVQVVADKFWKGLFRSDLQPGSAIIENIGTGQPQSLRDFAGRCWKEWNAKGRLLFGQVPYRDGEVMRYVPKL